MKKQLSLFCGICLLMSLCACTPAEEDSAGTSQPPSAPSGCSHNYIETVTKEATCTEDGQTTFTCSECDHSYTEVIPSKGHQEVLGICTVCGEKHAYYRELTDGPWTHYLLSEGTDKKAASLEEYSLDFENERFCYAYYEDVSALPSAEPDLTFLEQEWVNIPMGAPWASFQSVTKSDNTVTIKMVCMEESTMVLERTAHNKLTVVSIQGQTIPDAEGIIRVGTVFTCE